MGKMFQTNISWSGQNVSNNFVKIFNELYLFSMDFALCLTLDTLASLVIGRRMSIQKMQFRCTRRGTT